MKDLISVLDHAMNELSGSELNSVEITSHEVISHSMMADAAQHIRSSGFAVAYGSNPPSQQRWSGSIIIVAKTEQFLTGLLSNNPELRDFKMAGTH